MICPWTKIKVFYVCSFWPPFLCFRWFELFQGMLSWVLHSFLCRMCGCHASAFDPYKNEDLAGNFTPVGPTGPVVVVCADMLPRTFRGTGFPPEQRLQDLARFGGTRGGSPESCSTEHTFRNLGLLTYFCPALHRLTEEYKSTVNCVSLIFPTFYMGWDLFLYLTHNLINRFFRSVRII